MRRIFRDRTAIALILSVGVPTLTSAQVLPAADAARIGAERAAKMPELAQMLEQERGAGLTVDGLTCLMNAPKPCTDGTPLFTPQGIAVQLADDDSFVLAPAAQQTMRIDDKGQMVPIEGGKNYGAPRVEAGADAMTADARAAVAAAAGDVVVIPPGKEGGKAVKDAEKEAKNTEKQAEKVAAEASKAEDQAAKEAAKAAAKAANNTEKAAEDAAKAARKAEAAAQEAAAKKAADQQAAEKNAAEKKAAEKRAAERKAADEKAAQKKAADADARRAAAEAAAKGSAGAVVVVPAEPAKANAAKSAATAQDDLARALAERESAKPRPAPANKNPVVVPAAPAAAPVVAAAPAPAAPVPAAEQDALAEALAAAKATPEASAKETDAAREAAAATAAPAAAALTEAAKPVVTTEKTTVTEANSRAATEDFATDLSGQARAAVAAATAAAGGQTAPAVAPDAKDSSDSDLEKVLKQAILPALAGMAVGSMLSNNREVALNTGDRVIVTRTDGSQEIIKDDNALLFRPGSTVQTENYTDGSSRTVVARADGSQVITIRDADLRVLRRTVVNPDGTTTALIDETAAVQPVDIAALPKPAEPVVVMPGQAISDEALREALRRETAVDRSFSLGQIRNIPEVRALVAPVDIQAITFDTGSAAIKADQAQALSSLGRVIVEQIRQNPGEMFLIEGHTDTVGRDATNLALSDRRAESVALALTEFFQVPPENMVVQGYGEQFLKVGREGDVRANRRAAVRRITDLLARN